MALPVVDSERGYLVLAILHLLPKKKEEKQTMEKKMEEKYNICYLKKEWERTKHMSVTVSLDEVQPHNKFDKFLIALP